MVKNTFLRPIRSLSAPTATGETIADRLAPIRISEVTFGNRSTGRGVDVHPKEFSIALFCAWEKRSQPPNVSTMPAGLKTYQRISFCVVLLRQRAREEAILESFDPCIPHSTDLIPTIEVVGR